MMKSNKSNMADGRYFENGLFSISQPHPSWRTDAISKILCGLYFSAILSVWRYIWSDEAESHAVTCYVIRTANFENNDDIDIDILWTAW